MCHTLSPKSYPFTCSPPSTHHVWARVGTCAARHFFGDAAKADLLTRVRTHSRGQSKAFSHRAKKAYRTPATGVSRYPDDECSR